MPIWLTIKLVKQIGMILIPILLVGGIYFYGYSNGKEYVQLKWDAYKTEQVQLALSASEDARAREEVLQIRLRESLRDKEKEAALNKRIANGLRAESRQLRLDLATYAAGRSDDTIETLGKRAAALGNVLEEALRVTSILAEDAESINADLRAVLNAWPKIEKEKGP